MNMFKAILFGTIGLFAAVGCSRPQTIAGEWGHPFETGTGAEFVEFRKDGSFYFKTTSIAYKGEALLWSGTYTIVDSNHILLELTPGGLTNKPATTTPITVSYSLSKDGLELQSFSREGELPKYSRVR